MNRIANIPENNLPRIVIIGSGFAGMKLVRKLNKDKFEIILIDKNNYHQFQPLFYQVATAGLEPSSIAFPVRKAFQNYRHTHFRMAELLGINADEKEIETSIGKMNYDFLVLAIGADTNFFGQKDIENSSMPMKSVSEALRIRNTILENYEIAINTDDILGQQELMNIVIVGGGATGVELAGALAEMKKYIFPRDYPEIDFSKVDIYLVEANNRLLTSMTIESSKKAEIYLKNMGVKVIKDSRVKSFENKRVILEQGMTIPTVTLLWTAGIRVPLIKGIERAEIIVKSGRIKVNRFSQVESYNDIFAIGDMAYMEEPSYPLGHPQVAPPAIQQAVCLSKNMERLISEKSMKEFHYRHRGTMATVGRNRAVFENGKIRFGGFFAWAFWLFVHLMSIVGSKNRIFIFMNWMWNYMTYDQSLRLIMRPSGKKKN
jgi:NADH:ubiquinone reductase (H+-translocating)